MFKYTLAALALIGAVSANTGSTEGTKDSAHNAPVAAAQGAGEGSHGQAAASDSKGTAEEEAKKAEEGKTSGHSTTEGGKH